MTFIDEWVRDEKTGLEWSKSSIDRMIWEEAKRYCVRKGGRLPGRFELESIVDIERHDPCTNFEDTIFRYTKDGIAYAGGYWTNNEAVWDNGLIWVVWFSSGKVGAVKKYEMMYVRPVR